MSSVTAGEQVDGGVYVDVDGRRVWHFHGGDPSGQAIVLLHGAFGSAATWGSQIADFTGVGLNVYAPERSGHGHSPDHDGPFTYADMAAETIDYLENVVSTPAHLVGWSDGAVIALLVARQRPDLVNRMVLVANYVNTDGQEAAEFFSLIQQRNPSTVEFLRSGYVPISPDGPDHFDVVYEKTVAMLSREPEYDLDDFADVAAPTLVVAADRGVVRIEHVLALSRVLPHGRFAVLPGTHILPVESPELFNPLVVSFLAADPASHWAP
ncbi:alpha/beta fold hydrolase [Gordonia hankookensis]|uniref:Alpha/beta hydrolase n=1 Tax=Gordonia hankookensis TaxID=589403 RepID=A0ABR7WBF4_9ACTN|nr:alpha/beta hydrolase [Gordonia hankookensis]MBD1319122.1 alpha/beta hydrolase [Gordonia hankookensis]